ncbi:hypothetical protein HDU86_002605 [Geranomyces michiganensis]|nr:hypothetical protein HDU86_002605 [Geranomyces michiganensis]
MSWQQPPRPLKRRAEDNNSDSNEHDNNNNINNGGSRNFKRPRHMHEPAATAALAPVPDINSNTMPPFVQNPFAQRPKTVKRRREHEEIEEEDILEVSLLTPLNKRPKQEHLQLPSEQQQQPLQPSQFAGQLAAAAAGSEEASSRAGILALIPYARNQSLMTPGTAMNYNGGVGDDAAITTYQVNELLTGRLGRSQAWEPYRRAGLDEVNGQLVVYNGRKAWDYSGGGGVHTPAVDGDGGDDDDDRLDWTQGERFEEIHDEPEADEGVLARDDGGVCMMDIDS